MAYNKMKDIYKEILIKESINTSLIEDITNWFKKYKSNFKNNKLSENIKQDIISLIKHETSNIELMDKLTAKMLSISKQISDEDALDKLSDIILNI